jgi:putative Ca2+/H+ antiporter (TMEM165/GDT1 family)
LAVKHSNAFCSGHDDHSGDGVSAAFGNDIADQGVSGINMLDFLSVFASVFMAELGDKTQLATMLFASRSNLSPFSVFLAAAMALVLSTGIAVLVGNSAQQYLVRIPLKLIAGILFILIGLWTVWDHFRSAT